MVAACSRLEEEAAYLMEHVEYLDPVGVGLHSFADWVAHSRSLEAEPENHGVLEVHPEVQGDHHRQMHLDFVQSA